MKLSEKISEIVGASMTAKDPAWGNYVTTINDKAMGALARKHRIARKVRAVDVGRVMGVSKMRIYFIEKGRTAWSLEILTNYLRAVETSRKNNELSKVSASATAAKKTGPARKGR